MDITDGWIHGQTNYKGTISRFQLTYAGDAKIGYCPIINTIVVLAWLQKVNY